MPTAVIRPTAVDSQVYPSQVAATGGGTATVLSDESDSTYVRRSGSSNLAQPMVVLALADPSIPAANDVATIVPAIREKLGSVKIATGKVQTVSGILLDGTRYSTRSWGEFSLYSIGLGPSSVATKTMSTNAASAAYANTDAADCCLAVYDAYNAAHTNRATVYDIWATVYYATRPTCVPADPASLTTTTMPTIPVTFQATVESWQNNTGGVTDSSLEYELKLFTAAQVAAGGFSADTTVPIWSTTGVTQPMAEGTSTTNDIIENIVVGTALGATTTYHTYVRARRRFYNAQWSAWASDSFTMNVSVPTAPTVSISHTANLGRVSVGVTAQTATNHTSPVITVERSADNGATWTEIRNSGATGVFESIVNVNDYEAPRGVALKYRAAVTTQLTGGGSVTTTWTEGSLSAIAATGWNLKVPEQSSLNLIGVHLVTGDETSTTEDVGVFQPIGATRKVVVGGDVGGDDGSFRVKADSSGWAALKAVRDCQKVLYLESPFGWGRYIRTIGRSTAEVGAAGAQRYWVTFQYVETDIP